MIGLRKFVLNRSLIGCESDSCESLEKREQEICGETPMPDRRQWMKTVMASVAAGLVGRRAHATTHRQYYDVQWYYNPTTTYYYTYYYYRPQPAAVSYQYHYCIYYPSRPRYIYYYNPVVRVYWGRFDLEGKGDYRYSILASSDRKNNLEAIPESAFPKPAQMPFIPDSDNDARMDQPPSKNLPAKA